MKNLFKASMVIFIGLASIAWVARYTSNNEVDTTGNTPLEQKQDSVPITIYLDEVLFNDTNWEFRNYYSTYTYRLINKMLEKLSIDFRLAKPDIVSLSHFPDPLTIKNKDRYIEALNSKDVHNSNSFLHIYAITDEDFLRFANAMAFDHDGEKFIIGDAYMLMAPHLFLHELGHAFELPHSERLYSCTYKRNDSAGKTELQNNLRNFMNPMAIGCAPVVDVNQVHIMNRDYDSLGMNLDVQFPNDFKNSCCNIYFENNRSVTGSDYDVLPTIYYDADEMLVNNIDGHQYANPPLVSPANLGKYMYELLNGMDTVITTNLENNYEQMDSVYNFKGIDPIFAKNMVNIHGRMRANNIRRWLNVQPKVKSMGLEIKYGDIDVNSIRQFAGTLCGRGIIKCPKLLRENNDCSCF